MEFFLIEGGSHSYVDETIGDIEVPLRYKHLVKQWVPTDLPHLNTYFCVNERIFQIAPSSLNGLGLFCMDGIKVGYYKCTELMEYVRHYYNYRDWMRLVQYTHNMHKYRVSANYLQLKYNNQNKGASTHIKGRPKTSGNIAGFINSTQPRSKNKQPNCIFEGREGNRVFVLVVESDYLSDLDVCFGRAWSPFPNRGVRGVFLPHNCHQGGGDNFCIPPLVGDSGAVPLNQNFAKNCIVKYCNFVVNLDHSL
jgi:hypothetical protein